MKEFITFTFLIFCSFAIMAQLRLDVEGDAKIIGKLALDDGNQNVFIGTDVGLNNAPSGFFNGKENTFIGYQAGKDNTSGYANTFIGRVAGLNNTTGTDNTFIGQSAGRNNETGTDNTFIGRDAGHDNMTGRDNTYIGRDAGRKNMTGTKNTFIGGNANSSVSDSLDRAIAIGYNSEVKCHSCAVIGGTGDAAVKVGIGTDTPQSQLHIEAGVDASFTEHGYLVTGSITGANLVMDNNEIIARNNGAASDLYLNAEGGKVGIGLQSITPDERLDVNGNIKIRQIATSGSDMGQYVKIDANGKLFKTTTAPRIASKNPNQTILAKQKELLKAERAVIDNLKIANEEQDEIIVSLQEKVNELKSLVEKLLTQNTETPKSTSYVLPLEQKALLAQNQPNPFRENTLVNYFVPAEVQNAHIQVTSMDGQILGQVKITESGKGQVTIQSKSYPAGTYFYSLVLDGQVTETKRMVLAQ